MRGSISSYMSAFDNSLNGGSNWFERTFDPMKVEMAFNERQSALDRAFNSAEAEKQRQFEERMSNTSYQRAFEDMRAVGLNPYLMYNQGGASTPQGVSASARSHSVNGGANGQILGQVVRSAFGLASNVYNTNVTALLKVVSKLL